MQIDTYLFGKIDVAEQSIIEFPGGLPGLENCTRFALVHEDRDGQAASSFTLQSIDDPVVALQIADPASYGFHYELELSDKEAALLKSSQHDDVVVMLVLFRREDKSSPIEVNLRAPLLINARTRRGTQKIIEPQTTSLTLSDLALAVS